MKRLLIIIFIIVPLLSLSSCSNKSENVNFVLNSAISSGNLQNGGYVLKYQNNYIYANPDDFNNLYRKNVGDSKKEKISGNQYFYEMNLYDEDIYYISSSPGEIWKISLDGKNKKKICSDNVGNLIVYKDKIFFRLSEDNDWGKLFKMNLDGSNKVKLADKVNNFCINNDKIYFSDIENGYALCEMNINGENKKVLRKSYINFINLYDEDFLVYSDHNKNDRLFCYNINTEEEKCITEDSCWNINIYCNWILYRNQSDRGSLWCVDFNSKEKRKLIDGNITGIVVIEDVIFFKQITENRGYYYFNIKDALNNSDNILLSKL